MSRALFLVCYDISAQDRLHRTHKQVQAYAVGGQKSFYECWLTPAELRALKDGLAEILDFAEDRVHFFQLDPRMLPSFYGQAARQSIQPFLIV
ncbi:MAG: CRISPR-associated endonuclease Cas2 [Deltaproteobacteria bacterium]|jgi:CRISPR-associated protein Cas2|nr:CRISPR-associated endonuclease Cas2 [Deltaproteobacteria bacterium]